MVAKIIRDVREVVRRLRNRGISFDANRQYPAIPTIDDTIESHTNALRAIRESIETHERRNPKAALDSFVRLYELEDVLGGFSPGESSVTNIYGTNIEFATRIETDAGVITTKALNPDVGAYAYDRFRYAGQHAAGKGTATVTLTPDTGVVTLDGLLSNVFYLTLTENVTMANPVNPINGQTVNIHVKQDETGGWQIDEWGSQWKFTNRINPTFSTDPNAIDLLSCQWNETDAIMECSFLPNFGSDYTPPPPTSEGLLNFINLGGGNEVLVGRDMYTDEVNFRTIVGEGDVSVTTVDDTIVVSYSTPAVTDLTGVPFIITGSVDEFPGIPYARALAAGANIQFNTAVDGVLEIECLATSIPLEGTTGQVLAKLSDADLDVAWVDPPEGGGGGGGGGYPDELGYAGI